jgi:hypothetical protein
MTSNMWHGTDDELLRLRAAMDHNCTCTYNSYAPVNETCVSHALLADARVLDHLLYVYRMKDRLERAEWSGAPGAVTTLIDQELTS